MHIHSLQNSPNEPSAPTNPVKLENGTTQGRKIIQLEGVNSKTSLIADKVNQLHTSSLSFPVLQETQSEFTPQIRRLTFAKDNADLKNEVILAFTKLKNLKETISPENIFAYSLHQPGQRLSQMDSSSHVEIPNMILRAMVKIEGQQFIGATSDAEVLEIEGGNPEYRAINLSTHFSPAEMEQFIQSIQASAEKYIALTLKQEPQEKTPEKDSQIFHFSPSYRTVRTNLSIVAPRIEHEKTSFFNISPNLLMQKILAAEMLLKAKEEEKQQAVREKKLSIEDQEIAKEIQKADNRKEGIKKTEAAHTIVKEEGIL